MLASSLLIFCATAPLARAGWSSPAQVSALGEDGTIAQVAVSTDGTAAVVWTRLNGLSVFGARIRQVAPNGAMASIGTLQAASVDLGSPMVAIGANNTATAIWNWTDGTLDTAQMDSAGALGSAQTLGTSSGVLSADVASASDGSAIVGWADTKVRFRRISAGGVLGSVQDLYTPSGTDTVGSPEVAMAADGTATAIWVVVHEVSMTEFTSSVMTRQIATNDSLGSVHTLSDGTNSGGGGNWGSDHLALSADGTATVVFDTFEGSDVSVQARRVGPDGALDGGVKTISAAGEQGESGSVAVAPAGAATVVWNRKHGGNVPTERPIGANGTLGTAKSLDVASFSGTDPIAAVDDDGTFTAAWDRTSAVTVSSDGAKARRISSANDLSTTFDLAYDRVSDIGDSAASSPVAALYDPSSHEVAISRFSGPDVFLHAAGTLNPHSVNFGKRKARGAPGGAKWLTLKSTGTEALQVTSVKLTGGGKRHFVLAHTGACTAHPLAPGASCKIKTRFRPRAKGRLQAKLEAATDAGKLSVQLKGLGVKH